MALKQNAFYAQSGGVTSVINASACGVIESVNKSSKIIKVLAGKNGILGALNEELIDTSKETKSTIIKHNQIIDFLCYYLAWPDILTFSESFLTSVHIVTTLVK